MFSYDSLKTVTLKLLAYCQANNWAGYDPYDALNSRVFKYLPFLNFKLSRLAFTQILKRSPVNFRPLLLVPKTENPKAIALFLMAFLKLKRMGLLEDEGRPLWGRNIANYRKNIDSGEETLGDVLKLFEKSGETFWKI